MALLLFYCLALPPGLSEVSLILERPELLLPAQAWEAKGSILVLCHEAGVEELLHQARRGVAFLAILLHHLHLQLKGIVVGHLRCLPLLLLKSGLLLILDLLLSTTPLAPFLKEVGGHSLAG